MGGVGNSFGWRLDQIFIHILMDISEFMILILVYYLVYNLGCKKCVVTVKIEGKLYIVKPR